MDTNSYNSALNEPKQTFDGQDLYPDVITKAACYLRSFSMNHPFYDGNKRTALLSTIVFLEMNGYRITGSNQELYEFVRETVENRYSIETIVEKLKSYIRISKLSRFKEMFKLANKEIKKELEK